jgi:hypothetical protein
MDIRKYQRSAFRTNVVEGGDIYFLGLVGEVGSVFSTYKKIERDQKMIEWRATNQAKRLVTFFGISPQLLPVST